MGQPWAEIARAISASGAHDWAVHALQNVPGLPPIVQTIHLLSIAVVLGSIVLVSLRTLGLAAAGQDKSEMARRLAPWTWTAVPVLFASGLIFVLARPQRYFSNPVFGVKIALLISALVLTALLYRYLHRSSVTPLRWLAALTLVAWVGIVFAGRWIAYVDYLLPME